MSTRTRSAPRSYARHNYRKLPNGKSCESLDALPHRIPGTATRYARDTVVAVLCVPTPMSITMTCGQRALPYTNILFSPPAGRCIDPCICCTGHPLPHGGGMPRALRFSHATDPPLQCCSVGSGPLARPLACSERLARSKPSLSPSEASWRADLCTSQGGGISAANGAHAFHGLSS